MPYDTLVNLRFNRQTGPYDLCRNTWEYENLTFADPGRFTGNSGYWDDRDTSLYKVDGQSLNIPSTTEFTFSAWFHLLDLDSPNYSTSARYFLISDGDFSSDTTKNSIYIDYNRGETKICIVDNIGTLLESDEVSIQRGWNYLAIVRFKGISRVFLNGKLVGITPQDALIAELRFDTIRCTFGTGVYNGRQTYFHGYMDDIVIMRTAIPNLEDSIDIPNTFLTEYLEPDTEVDIDGWEDKESEYSRHDAIVEVTEDKRSRTATVIGELQNGVTPYIVKPIWYTGNPYFINGTYTSELDANTIPIHLSGVKNNALFTHIAPDYFSMDMLSAYNRTYTTAFLLFVDKKFVKWSRIRIIRSDIYTTLLVNGFPREYEIQSIHVIMMPFNVSYAENGMIDDTAKPEFIFNDDGYLDEDGRIYIGSLDMHTATLMYWNQQFDKFKVNVDLDHKITKNNIIVFDEDGLLDDGCEVSVFSGNLVTVDDPPDAVINTKSIILTYYYTDDKSEDYIDKFPNATFAKQIAAEEETDIPIPDIDIELFRNEFDFTHRKDWSYEDNINASIEYIWDYDKNKYDKVYEDIRPVNIIEYDPADILAMRNDVGEVTMSRDIYGLDDNHNQTFVLIFHNGELASYFHNATFTDNTFTFVPSGLNNGDTFEVVYFRNIRNELIPLDKSHKDDPDYLKVSPTYIPIDDLMIYTDKLGETQLYPLLYTYDYTENKIILKYDKYLDTNLYIGSRNQFAYDMIEVYDDTNRIFLNNTFRSCYNPDKYLFFINGRLVNSIYYRVLIPSLTNADIEYKCIYSMINIHAGDRVEVVYLGSNGIGMHEAYTGELLIKPMTTYATQDNQLTFVIPLPFKDYDLTNVEGVAILRHGIFKHPDMYHIYEENGVWYVTFLDVDEEAIVGEEVTFLFPYYTTDLTIDEMPTPNNTTQLITRYVHIDSALTTVSFPADSMGDIEDKNSILVFKGTEIVPPEEYSIPSPNTIQFNESVENTDIAVVIQTDRYDLTANNIAYSYTKFDITEKAQNGFTLPFGDKESSYIVFFNSTLLNPSQYTVVNNILIIEPKYNYNRAGDVLHVFCTTDTSTDKNVVNWYPLDLELVYPTSIDIPNFNSSYTLNDTSIILFINDEYVSPSHYTVNNKTITFNEAHTRGDKITVYISYKTLNRSQVSYQTQVQTDPNSALSFTPMDVVAQGDGQNSFEIPYPTIYTDSPFVLFIRGTFVAENDYYVNPDKTTVTLNSTRSQIKQGDLITFLFCHAYGNLPVIKEEYTYPLPNGVNTVTIPDIYKQRVDYNNRMMLFYGSIYLDKKRYTINSEDNVITFDDIPYNDDNNRNITMVFFYSGSAKTGTVTYIPQSGYLRLDRHKIYRNYNKEMYMFFVNGKKIAKSQIMDVTNSLKKITVDIKTRFGLEMIMCSPLVSEFKSRFITNEEPVTYNITINQTSAHQRIKVRSNGIVHENSFRVEEGTLIEPYVESDLGYTAGSLKTKARAMTVNDNIILEAFDPIEQPLYPVNIWQQPNQLITVICNGNTYTDSFQEISGASFYVSVESTDIGYAAGTPNIRRGLIGNEPVNIYSTPVQPIECEVKINGDNLSHQSFTVNIYDTLDDKYPKTIISPMTLTVKRGSYMILGLAPDRGYEVNRFGKYKLNQPYRILEDIELTADPPTGPMTVPVYIPDNLEHQKVIVTINTGSSTVYYTKSFTAIKGDSYSIAIQADKGYEPGEIVLEEPITGTLDHGITIGVTQATKILNTYEFKIDSDDISTIYAELSSGKTVKGGETTTVLDGDSYKVYAIAGNGYSNPTMSSIGGVIHDDTHIVIVTPAKKLEDEDYTKMAHIILNPKSGTTITVYSDTTKQIYTESFYTLAGTRLYFNYTKPSGTFITPSMSSPFTVPHNGEYTITTTAPLPISQQEKVEDQYKRDTVSIYTDNLYSITQLIKVVYNGEEYTNSPAVKNIPLGEEITISLEALTKPGQLYINGYRIPNNTITFKPGSYTEDPLTQATTYTVSCTDSILDSTCVITYKDYFLDEQKLVAIEDDGVNKKEITLPYTIDCRTISDSYKIKFHLEANDGYMPGKCNYQVITPIEGARYEISCTPASEVNIDGGAE